VLHRRLLLAALVAAALALPGPGGPEATAGVSGALPGSAVPPATVYAGPRPIDLPPPSPTALARVGWLVYPAIDLALPAYRWGCRGGTLPDLAVRWDCAGQNNTYLLGHAWGVFLPLYQARLAGRLQVGQHATYSDTSGQTTRYEVAWIRIVPRTYIWRGLTGDRWAWNATRRQALTLQTCWGATSAYRLIVRLYEDRD